MKALVLALLLGFLQGQLYEEKPLDSRATREQQWKQWDAYLAAVPKVVDLSSPEAFARTIGVLRKNFAAQVGYPPPRLFKHVKARMERIGEDEVATYHRCWVPIAPGLEVYGLYIVPKNIKLPAPLVISMHGGGGYPELATFQGGANYHDMVRGAVARGYITFAPLALQYPYGDRDHDTPIPQDARQRVNEELVWRGTTLGAVEVAKISKALDALLERKEIDPKRIAMVGLSMGGSHTVLTAALEPRIKVAVVSGSPSIESAQLICPRALHFQFGDKDKLIGGVTGRTKSALEQIEKLYQRLGIADRFELKVFDGVHEWRGDIAWEFLKKHL